MNNRIFGARRRLVDLLILSCAAMMASTSAVQGAASPAQAASVEPKVDVSSLVDPELLPLARSFDQYGAVMERITPEMLPKMRQSMPATAPLPEPKWSERVISGRNGAPDVRIYVINAGTRATPRPAILHVHGGGFIIGTAKDSVPGMQEIAAALDCVVVTVDYRLAPETTFPGSLEDNYAGLKWLYDSAAELGVDRTRIAVMGESAGGGHAAMLAIAARDRKEVPLVFQALVYPMLDDRTGSTRTVPPHIGTVLWTRGVNRFGWSSLLGVAAGSEQVPNGAVPAREPNLVGLPRAFIGVGSLDLFVQEDIQYAQRLIEAGVNTELLVVPGAFHGFDAARDANVSKQFKSALLGALSRAFAKQ